MIAAYIHRPRVQLMDELWSVKTKSVESCRHQGDDTQDRRRIVGTPLRRLAVACGLVKDISPSCPHSAQCEMHEWKRQGSQASSRGPFIRGEDRATEIVAVLVCMHIRRT